MGQSAAICCSNRDKYDQSSNGLPRQFDCSEVQLQLDNPRCLAFGPLWQRDVLLPRRLAVAAEREVHVYRLPEVELNEVGHGMSSVVTPRDVFMEHRFSPEDGMEVTCMLFADELSSRNLVIATAASAGGSQSSRPPRIRIYNCDAVPKAPSSDSYQTIHDGTTAGSFRVPVNVWLPDDCLHSLEDHSSPVTHMAVSQSYLISVDSSGACCVWHKSKGFVNKQSSRIHQSGIVDLAVDRFFVYSIGSQDKSISIWSLPALMQVAVVSVEIPKDILYGLRYDANVPVAACPIAEDEVPDVVPPSSVSSLSKAQPRSSNAFAFSRLTALKRPLSRWAGSQGSSRNPKQVPKGMLYIAGVLAETCEVAGSGAGILMEWSLSSTDDGIAHCQSAQVAHDSPIVAIGYGPYDNGPIITADERGVFRVWDTVPRLICAQHIEFFRGPNAHPSVSMAMEPRRGFYSSMGDKRLFVWRRTQAHRLF